MTWVTMEVRPPRRITTGVQMLGPLPTLHRFVLVLAALVVCVGIGFWFGAMPTMPFTLRLGLIAGAAAGVMAGFVLVHDFHHRQVGTTRVRRRAH
ncbi:hypothetical protein [Nocardioides hwasunensis]|uniref:DUF2530 domain-containing protein n=1 Tax=Nocardioides hwasunensis TaxID=397258 RepID=A0ABR8MBP1_9ACTN|nr:hypothetical protein [Nocardioides hwasunensis]MBD3913352.1 hypothetical protein [Nocardioides hwasunensis]